MNLQSTKHSIVFEIEKATSCSFAPVFTLKLQSAQNNTVKLQLEV
jgi:hypothetical protein